MIPKELVVYLDEYDNFVTQYGSCAFMRAGETAQEWLIHKIFPIIEERVKREILQAIIDEPEYPSDMPDELWEKLNGNRELVLNALRSTVRLTKNGITERFLQALKQSKEEGE